jgi:hypothetical protein
MKPFSELPEVKALAATTAEKVAAVDKIKSDITNIETQLNVGETDHASRVSNALDYARTGNLAATSTGQLHDRHALLRQQVEALTNSIKADREALAAMQGEASAAASRELDSEHKKIAAQALAALQAFDAACQAEQDLFGKLGASGFDPRFRQYVGWYHIGRLNDNGSALASQARDLKFYSAR